VRSRKIVVKGPRGTLSRTFKHLAVDIKMEGTRKIKVVKWFGKRKELAAVNTVCSHIQNMFKGVTRVCAKFLSTLMFVVKFTKPIEEISKNLYHKYLFLN